MPFELAAAATLLSLLDPLLSGQGKNLAIEWVNRSLGIGMTWLSVLAVVAHRRSAVLEEATNQRAREYLDVVSVAVRVVDRDGRVVLLNRRGLEWLDRSAEELIGSPWEQHILPEDRGRWRESLAALDSAGPARSTHASRVVSRDGSIRVVVWNNVILKDERGRAIGLLSSGEEITARLATENALRRSLKDLEDIKFALDQSAIVATTNVRGDITSVNDKFCEISKYSRDELIGRNHRMLNSGLHPREFFDELYATVAKGGVWRGEIRNRAKDGAIYWVDTTVVPLVDEQRRQYQFVSIQWDITERKDTEIALREQESFAQLGKMAAVVAHEVRNPLAGIRGALQVIARRQADGSREREIAHETIERIDTLNDIMQDLLQFARPRQPVVSPVTVSTLISETVELFRADPALAGLDVRIDATGASVSADAEQLKLVLLNLLINGAQAMGERGDLAIVARQDGARVEVRIIDQGPGIPAEVRDHLFEPFFTTKHRGTGLGLATARRMLEAQGGSIRLECPPGGGTVAIVTLPSS
jgi:PAS domain S-box-containing protein